MRKFDAPLVGHLGLAIDHPPLHLGGTAHRINDAREFREQTVAGVLDDAAPVLKDLRIYQLPEMRPEAFVGAFLVRLHQTRVACYICSKYRRKTADRGRSA